MKKNKRRLGFVLGALMACMLLLLVSGCGEEYAVSIEDMGEKTEVTVTSGTKVQKVLEDAGITLGDQDEVSPELTEKIKEDTDITIKRYAAVTVVAADGTEYPVECVGGTVADAIAASGLTLGEGQTPDTAEDTYLADGMTITILQAASVNLTADGATNAVYTNADTVEAFLTEQGITLGENDRITPELTEAVTDGMSVTVQRVEIKEEVVTEEIAYETETQESNSLASGKTETKQAGVNGTKDVTYRVTYVDGVEESREVVSETVTKEPVTEIIVKGTKQAESASSSSASSETTRNGKTIVSKEKQENCNGDGHGFWIYTYSDGSMEEVPY